MNLHTEALERAGRMFQHWSGGPLTAPIVAELVGLPYGAWINGALSRLFEEGRIERVSRGRYQPRRLANPLGLGGDANESSGKVHSDGRGPDADTGSCRPE